MIEFDYENAFSLGWYRKENQRALQLLAQRQRDNQLYERRVSKTGKVIKAYKKENLDLMFWVYLPFFEEIINLNLSNKFCYFLLNYHGLNLYAVSENSFISWLNQNQSLFGKEIMSEKNKEYIKSLVDKYYQKRPNDPGKNKRNYTRYVFNKHIDLIFKLYSELLSVADVFQVLNDEKIIEGFSYSSFYYWFKRAFNADLINQIKLNQSSVYINDSGDAFLGSPTNLDFSKNKADFSNQDKQKKELTHTNREQITLKSTEPQKSNPVSEKMNIKKITPSLRINMSNEVTSKRSDDFEDLDFSKRDQEILSYIKNNPYQQSVEELNEIFLDRVREKLSFNESKFYAPDYDLVDQLVNRSETKVLWQQKDRPHIYCPKHLYHLKADDPLYPVSFPKKFFNKYTETVKWRYQINFLLIDDDEYLYEPVYQLPLPGRLIPMTEYGAFQDFNYNHLFFLWHIREIAETTFSRTQELYHGRKAGDD